MLGGTNDKNIFNETCGLGLIFEQKSCPFKNKIQIHGLIIFGKIYRVINFVKINHKS